MHSPTRQSQKHGQTRLLSKAIQEQKTSQEHCVQCSTNGLVVQQQNISNETQTKGIHSSFMSIGYYTSE